MNETKFKMTKDGPTFSVADIIEFVLLLQSCGIRLLGVSEDFPTRVVDMDDLFLLIPKIRKFEIKTENSEGKPKEDDACQKD